MGYEESLASGTAGVHETDKIDEAKNKARDIAQDAKRQAQEKLDIGKERAANQTEKLAGAVERAAQELRSGELGALSDYAAQLAGGMKTFAENLRSKSLDELLTDTQQLARKNPAVFFIGSVGIGLAISRFLKASGERTQRNYAEPEYPLATQPATEPAVFERGPAVMPERGSPNPGSWENPSFADDLKKGV